jgi:hypothetical protein
VEVLVLAVWHGIPIIEAPVHAIYGLLKEGLPFPTLAGFLATPETFARFTRILIPQDYGNKS